MRNLKIRIGFCICITCALAGAMLLPTAKGAAKAGRRAAGTTRPTTAASNYVRDLGTRLEPTRQVVYKKVAGRELHLHVFEPKDFKPADKRPCFVTIHGGGWVNGEPRVNYAFAQWAADHGMVGISVEYRLMTPGSDVTPFECVKDGRSATRYVRAHAADFGIDPQKIIANGASAGGHVAAATALFDGIDEAGEDTTVSCVPNALVLHFPVIDTSKEGYGNEKCGEKWKDISPAHQVKPNLPPTLIFHGTGDTTCPFKGAQLFHDEMIKSGNRCELKVNQGGTHGFLMREKGLYDQAMREAEEFLAPLGLMK